MGSEEKGGFTIDLAQAWVARMAYSLYGLESPVGTPASKILVEVYRAGRNSANLQEDPDTLRLKVMHKTWASFEELEVPDAKAMAIIASYHAAEVYRKKEA